MESSNSGNFSLSSLRPAKGSRHVKKRVGFGEGSGHGKTAGRGGKGQSARSGYSRKLGFEGGQMPLYRRLPKVGFKSRKRILGENVFTLVTTGELEALNLSEVTVETLIQSGLVRSDKEKVKILVGGELKSKINVTVNAYSATAKAAIEAAGGTANILA